MTRTLDVERAQKWLAASRTEPILGSRQLAELLHDYSLTVERTWDDPTGDECNELARKHCVDVGAAYSVLWYFVHGRNKALQPTPVDPRKEKIVKAMLVDERTSSRGLWPTDAAYFADKILAALDK
jgi:hypothetical protein